MVSLPEEYRYLFEKKTIAHFATHTPDGKPHVTPVWIDYDDETNRLLINTARGRQKERNVDQDAAVGVSMTDPDDPQTYLSVVGVVDEITTEGAREHVHELAGRYTGTAEYQNPIPPERVLIKIRPERVLS